VTPDGPPTPGPPTPGPPAGRPSRSPSERETRGARPAPAHGPVTAAAFGPGRVNLVGEHTDYNDGLCLPVAIDLGVTVLARPSSDRTTRVHAVDLGAYDAFPTRAPGRAEGWRAFARGVVAELDRAGYPPRPARLTVSGTLPRGAGLSSSAAIEVALALALLEHSGQPEPDRLDLARLLSRVENDWVGARTGLLDQIASLFGRTDHALLLDLRDLSIEPVPLELRGWRLVTAASGVRHTNAESGYNTRRAQCQEACRLLGVASLRDADPAAAAALPPPLDRRVRHVLEENDRVRRAAAALGAGDLADLGRVLDESHRSLRDLYEVSVPAVEDTVARLRSAGAAGARLVGGGFGGSVLALFEPGRALPAGTSPVTPGPGGHLVDGHGV
jgi:galactokinase